MNSNAHVAIVGGGIAGASAAYSLSLTQQFDRVLLIEAEPQLAMHTTGRSAAVLTENYGAGPVRPLTAASLSFLHDPPESLVDGPLLHKRGLLTVATRPEDHAELEKQLAAGTKARHPIIELGTDEAQLLAPHIELTASHRTMWEAESHDIDVAALHQAFIRGLRLHGGEILTSNRVDSAHRNTATSNDKPWRLETTKGPISVDIVVNAAGAWGDLVATTAGIKPVGLQPMRRTAFMTASPFEGSGRFPFLVDVLHRWYLRPDGTQFMCSPADEIPSEPCDARAEEIDIARAIELINAETKLNIRSISSQWAGLRTFGPDRAMVIGPEPTEPSFVWCVGQGGTGIQTSPGAGQLVADLVTLANPGESFADTGLNVSELLPDRLRG